MIKLAALNISKLPKHHLKHQDDVLNDVLEVRLITVLENNRQATQKEIAVELGISIATVQRKIKKLSDKKIIVRKGGKRFGYWEILR